VLLPTYNRARFLPAAFEALAAQTLEDWELVIVDDGSTDETPVVLDRLCRTIAQPVVRVVQPNAGAYAARNTALDRATAPFVAFYDSDDVWLPHHLETCVAALQAAPDLAWVYAACRIVDFASGRLLDADTFRVAGEPRPFQRLRTRGAGAAKVFEDGEAAVACALRHGLYCGLQNSVIRRHVFETGAFRTEFRNEAEDQLFVIRALKRGHRVGYIDHVHVQYHVHDANSSASATTRTLDRELAVYRPVARGFETLLDEFTWTPRERRAIARRLGREFFWHIGYRLLWTGGRRSEALAAYRTGLRYWPWSPACWKTYVLARLRMAGAAS
jgi:glycosyltransferase involved in cell wall biosynthesis